MFDKATGYRIVNLTPHPVRLVHELCEPIPSKGVARCTVTSHQVGTISVDGAKVPEIEETYGELIDLPPPAPYTIYLLSQIACRAAAALGRTDCRYPAGIVRRPDGEVSHATHLGRV